MINNIVSMMETLTVECEAGMAVCAGGVVAAMVGVDVRKDRVLKVDAFGCNVFVVNPANRKIYLRWRP
jgi:hypothetical protein